MRKLGWIAFVGIALLVSVRVVTWAQTQHSEASRVERELAPSPRPTLPPPASAGGAVINSAESVAIDSQGRRLPGVRIYGHDGTVPYRLQLLGKTDSRGEARLAAGPGQVAISPDGRLAFWELDDDNRNVFRFGPTGSVRLHFTDGRGRPWAHQRVSIDQETWIEPIDTFGKRVQDREDAAAVDALLSGRTNARGDIVFRKMPLHQGFAVTVHPKGELPMKFLGAVRPGQKVRLQVADRWQVTGKVLHGPTGSPMPGVRVELVETNDGAFPNPLRRQATTDSQGRYQFSGLRNCAYSVRLADPVKPHLFGWVYSRTADGKWRTRGGIGPNGPGVDSFYFNMHTRLRPKGPVTACDFQWFQTGTIHVKLAHWSGKPKVQTGLFFKRASGEEWYGEIGDDGSSTVLVPPGDYTVNYGWFGDSGREEIRLGRYRVREGETTVVKAAKPKG